MYSILAAIPGLFSMLTVNVTDFPAWVVPDEIVSVAPPVAIASGTATARQATLNTHARTLFILIKSLPSPIAIKAHSNVLCTLEKNRTSCFPPSSASVQIFERFPL
jgi:hypothetical protein